MSRTRHSREPTAFALRAPPPGRHAPRFSGARRVSRRRRSTRSFITYIIFPPLKGRVKFPYSRGRDGNRVCPGRPVNHTIHHTNAHTGTPIPHSPITLHSTHVSIHTAPAVPRHCHTHTHLTHRPPSAICYHTQSVRPPLAPPHALPTLSTFALCLSPPLSKIPSLTHTTRRRS